jgi:hypothetical protein
VAVEEVAATVTVVVRRDRFPWGSSHFLGLINGLRACLFA